MLKWRADSRSSQNALVGRRQGIKVEEERQPIKLVNVDKERDINLTEDTDEANTLGEFSKLDAIINTATHMALSKEPMTMTNTECEQRHRGKRMKDFLQKGAYILQKWGDFRIGDHVPNHRAP
jgi:hypothetical protein